ncbi:Aldo/keto reductase [Corynespora cassiicola Philippines]|uniref:Aldo/keto reductase n=1 Tax=Corynespora cassiicola Philippines TaxID=1448308 RepID=A0A2T2P8Y4_CORCC|nr:Aldo/keto reductase [Corynespora cassiicola Philippines]
MPPPKVYFGKGTIGEAWDKEKIEKLIATLKELGIREIDATPIYPLGEYRRTEQLIGEFSLENRGFRIDTQAQFSGTPDGSLSHGAVQESLDQSLKNLQAKKVNVFYAHGLDKITPIAEQAAAFDAEYRKGKFSKLGLCNIRPDAIEEWINVAEEKGYVKPSVFSGQYNLLCRTYEQTLVPLLRKHDFTFVALSPLAGGFLAGKVKPSSTPEELKGTSFDPSNGNIHSAQFREWYDRPSMHAAVQKLEAICKEHDIDMAYAAYRWVLHHSVLDGGPVLGRDKGDGVIIGPDSIGQLSMFVEAYGQGPLPDDLVKALDGIWEDVKEDSKSIVT